MKVLVVRSAPSAGSTLLADLLDSAPGSVCPPELYVFSDPDAYAYGPDFKARALARVPVQPKAPYARPRQFFNNLWLAQTGLDLDLLKTFIADANSLAAFVAALAARQAQFRGRDVAVFCEKTPININEAGSFCQAFPDGLFVHVTRDPVTALPSIQRRGFGLYEAALIWAHQNWAGLEAQHFPNYRRVSYEDLIAAPFTTVRALLAAAGHDVDAADIEGRFAVNAYRQALRTPGTWSVGKRGGVEQRRDIGTPSRPRIANC